MAVAIGAVTALAPRFHGANLNGTKLAAIIVGSTSLWAGSVQIQRNEEL
jgi:hypothetical protein